MDQQFDVIGDIHGHAAALERLLAAMGYARRDGAWMHAERQAAFVGDFVDRGPESLRCCRIAMDMIEAGAAQAVMGNHEFNHLCLATPDPNRPGGHLRPHTEKNLHQAGSTLTEMARDPASGRRVLGWMRRLPLWLDLPNLRVVHASWSKCAMAVLGPFLDAGGAFTDDGLVRAARKRDPVRLAREALLNGVETVLPEGRRWVDRDGHARPELRLKWWLAGASGLGWADAALAPPEVIAQLPPGPLPPESLGPADDDPRPVLFGHYWLRPPLAILTPKHACVDASVAAGGILAAYRHAGKAELSEAGFVYA